MNHRGKTGIYTVENSYVVAGFLKQKEIGLGGVKEGKPPENGNTQS